MKGMTRANDPETSIAAAERILQKLSPLKQDILDAVRELHRENGGRGATDKEIEVLPRWSGRCGYSTVRKRMGELRDAHFIEWSGEIRDGAHVNVPVAPLETLRRQQAAAEGTEAEPDTPAPEGMLF